MHGPYTISLTLSSSTGCANDTKTMMIDLAKPVVSAGPDIFVTTTDPIQLNATGATTYQWRPTTFLDNPNIANPMMKARDPITYVITGTNAGGCSSTDTLRVTIGVVKTIEVPNAFRPSGISNPVLRPILREIKELKYFRVYNRWGQLVFATKTIGHGWDGTFDGQPQQTGSYVWVLEVVDLDGVVIQKRGSSILIR
jgi:gliding motility-associated-like protein